MRDEPEEHGIRATIEGQALSLFVDYDRPRLMKLSLDGKLEYFRRRFDFVVIEPLVLLLEEHLAPSNRRGKDASLLLIWGNSMLCAIEALGHFLTPASASNFQAFRKFISMFMDPSWEHAPALPPTPMDSYSRWFWVAFRNGLAHGAYIKKGGFEKLGDRLFIESPAGLKVDPWALDIDFRRGFEKMFQALAEPESSLRSMFIARFDRAYILGEA